MHVALLVGFGRPFLAETERPADVEHFRRAVEVAPLHPERFTGSHACPRHQEKHRVQARLVLPRSVEEASELGVIHRPHVFRAVATSHLAGLLATALAKLKRVLGQQTIVDRIVAEHAPDVANQPERVLAVSARPLLRWCTKAGKERRNPTAREHVHRVRSEHLRHVLELCVVAGERARLNLGAVREKAVDIVREDRLGRQLGRPAARYGARFLHQLRKPGVGVSFCAALFQEHAATSARGVFVVADPPLARASVPDLRHQRRPLPRAILARRRSSFAAGSGTLCTPVSHFDTVIGCTPSSAASFVCVSLSRVRSCWTSLPVTHRT
jgi:hypothetical protein